MSTPSNPAPTSAPAPRAAAPAPAQMPPTPVILGAMLRAAKNVSDSIFSPGRLPQVEQNGQLVPVKIHGVPVLTPEDTARVVSHLIGTNKAVMEKLCNEGSCDISYSLPRVSRFRVNIFTQRGTCAIVMRVNPNSIPDFAALSLPPQLADVANLKNGIVLVTGPTGSGKSSTLAAILNKINEEKAYHIVTIEDPIEFLHPHKKATIHQRELHSNTPTFALALRAALRQAPKVSWWARCETRRPSKSPWKRRRPATWFSPLCTPSTLPKPWSAYRGLSPVGPADDPQPVCQVVSLHHLATAASAPDDAGRVAAVEILKSTLRTREYLEKGEEEGRSLVDAMRDGELEGMQDFDTVIEKMIRSGVVDTEAGLTYATNSGNLRLQLTDMDGEPPPELVTP